MNFKKYHVSRNLWNEDYTGIGTSITYLALNVGDGEFTMSTTAPSVSAGAPLFLLSGNVSSGASTATNGVTSQTSRTVSSTGGYITVAYRNVSGSHPEDYDTMLNTGSTPLPYEPYSSEVWHDTPHYIHKTDTDTITTLPADIYANSTTATVGLKGNMYQASGVSPTTPIQPQETGERTANLLPFSDKTFTITINRNNLTVTCSNGNLYFSGTVVNEISSVYSAWKTNFAFDLEAGTYYCNSPSPLGAGFGRYIKKYSDDTTILRATDYTFTLSETTKCYLSLYISGRNLDTQINLMLNTGSTALPYEPYGYFIEIEVS